MFSTINLGAAIAINGAIPHHYLMIVGFEKKIGCVFFYIPIKNMDILREKRKRKKYFNWCHHSF